MTTNSSEAIQLREELLGVRQQLAAAEAELRMCEAGRIRQANTIAALQETPTDAARFRWLISRVDSMAVFARPDNGYTMMLAANSQDEWRALIDRCVRAEGEQPTTNKDA